MITNRRSRRRAFSIAEMLIALAIGASLLAATLAALDASFKGYKTTTESASSHVVTRIVMQRIMALIRTGSEFGPYPIDVLDPETNPLVSTYIEFLSAGDRVNGQVTRLERRENDESDDFELWYVLLTYEDGELASTQERPLIRNVRELAFTLEYDVGPRLRRATVDLSVQPDDFQDAGTWSQLEPPTIRLVSSTSPRQLD